MRNEQKNIFLNGEGDAWFKRNKKSLEDRMDFGFLDHFLPYLKPGSRVLEIGCANGANLKYIRNKTGCECFGIDPSEKAIRNEPKTDGIELSVSSADDYEFDKPFDLIFFGFCLYLTDRSLLSKVIYNADRHLVSPGFLGIIDFDCPYLVQKIYQHKVGVSSYKADYSNLFLCYPSYSLVSKYSFSHQSSLFDAAEDERVASWLLYKNNELGYSVQS